MIVRTVPAVEKLEELLLLRVLAGEFVEQGRLPSRHELSRQYGVSRNTVGAAIGRLIARGVCVPRIGTGVVPVLLIHAIDHKLLLELVRRAEDAAHAMRLLQQVLASVRRLLVPAAGEAAERRSEDHVRALGELVEAVETEVAEGGACDSAASHEYNLWRIVAGGSGNVAVTSELNSLRPIWADSEILRGLSHSPPVELIISSARSIIDKKVECARDAAHRLCISREDALATATAKAAPLPLDATPTVGLS